MDRAGARDEPDPVQARLDDWWRENAPGIRSYLRSRGAPPHLAEDIVQDVAVAVMAHVDEKKALPKPAWAFRFARWRLIDHYRRDRRSWPDAESPPALSETREGDPEASLAQKELRAVIERASTALPSEQRKVFEAWLEGEEPIEIARRQEKVPATVRSLLRHAKTTVTDRLEEAVGEKE